MTLRAISVLVVLGLTGAGLAAYAIIRPEPVPAFTDGLGEPNDCTTCDARQASKKKLRDYLQSKDSE